MLLAWIGLIVPYAPLVHILIKLAADYIRPPSTRIHPTIRIDFRLYPYLENCTGAIDGTHILAHILGSEQIRFWNRKHQLMQNVTAVCNWDMEFYVFSCRLGRIRS